MPFPFFLRSCVRSVKSTTSVALGSLAALAALAAACGDGGSTVGDDGGEAGGAAGTGAAGGSGKSGNAGTAGTSAAGAGGKAGSGGSAGAAGKAGSAGTAGKAGSAGAGGAGAAGASGKGGGAGGTAGTSGKGGAAGAAGTGGSSAGGAGSSGSAGAAGSGGNAGAAGGSGAAGGGGAAAAAGAAGDGGAAGASGAAGNGGAAGDGGAGGSPACDPSSPPPDGNECTADACDGDVATYVPMDDGTACTDGTCQAGVCSVVCGDGVRSSSEICDGADLAGASCESIGLGPGVLACDASCALDTSGCTAAPPACGNGVVEDGEECDDLDSPAQPGNGCSATCTREPLAGELVITELMYDPEAAVTSGGNELGEWVEVYNATALPFDLRGLTVASLGATENAVITGPSPIVIPAFGYVVLAKSGDAAQNGGVSPAYAYGNGISLSNGATDGFRIQVASPLPLVIDSVTYTPSAAYKGAAYALASGLLDATSNDDGANFCPAQTAFGDGDLGTPGAPNDCPLPGSQAPLSRDRSLPSTAPGAQAARRPRGRRRSPSRRPA